MHRFQKLQTSTDGCRKGYSASPVQSAKDMKEPQMPQILGSWKDELASEIRAVARGISFVSKKRNPSLHRWNTDVELWNGGRCLESIVNLALKIETDIGTLTDKSWDSWGWCDSAIGHGLLLWRCPWCMTTIYNIYIYIYVIYIYIERTSFITHIYMYTYNIIYRHA